MFTRFLHAARHGATRAEGREAELVAAEFIGRGRTGGYQLAKRISMSHGEGVTCAVALLADLAGPGGGQKVTREDVAVATQALVEALTR